MEGKSLLDIKSAKLPATVSSDHHVDPAAFLAAPATVPPGIISKDSVVPEKFLREELEFAKDDKSMLKAIGYVKDLPVSQALELLTNCIRKNKNKTPLFDGREVSVARLLTSEMVNAVSSSVSNNVKERVLTDEEKSLFQDFFQEIRVNRGQATEVQELLIASSVVDLLKTAPQLPFFGKDLIGNFLTIPHPGTLKKVMEFVKSSSDLSFKDKLVTFAKLGENPTNWHVLYAKQALDLVNEYLERNGKLSLEEQEAMAGFIEGMEKVKKEQGIRLDNGDYKENMSYEHPEGKKEESEWPNLFKQDFGRLVSLIKNLNGFPKYTSLVNALSKYSPN